MTVWQRIFKELEEAGVNVYPPATKKGECTERYVVLKQDGKGQVGTFSSEYSYYHFILHVPQNQYDKLSEYEKEVKEVLNAKVYPLLIPLSSDMPDYYDDVLKAHTRSFLYRNSVRNRYL